jgi:hypothetical protein
MVPSSALVVTADSECLSCDGFSLVETILFGRLEFIADFFGGMSLSPRRDHSDVTVMGSSCSGPPSPLWVMIGDSTKEFHAASDEEGWIDLLSPRRHDMGASLTPAITISWPENTPTTQATAMIQPPENTPTTQATALIQPWQVAPRPDIDLPFE